MPARKPKIEYYWTPYERKGIDPTHVVNWRLVGANGEIMCQSTQGFRDKTDARRSFEAVVDMFFGMVAAVREVGPGRKPS